MAILEHLEPRGVFRFFEELCAIPHGSSNTKAVSDWLMDFARERGLEAYQDGHRVVFCPGTILPSLLAVSRRAVCLSFHHLFLWDILFYHEIVYDEVLPLHCVLAHVILK